VILGDLSILTDGAPVTVASEETGSVKTANTGESASPPK
jgi:hypothetical protein